MIIRASSRRTGIRSGPSSSLSSARETPTPSEPTSLTPRPEITGPAARNKCSWRLTSQTGSCWARTTCGRTSTDRALMFATVATSSQNTREAGASRRACASTPQVEAVARGYRAMQYNLVVPTPTSAPSASGSTWGSRSSAPCPAGSAIPGLGFVDAHIMYKVLAASVENPPPSPDPQFQYHWFSKGLIGEHGIRLARRSAEAVGDVVVHVADDHAEASAPRHAGDSCR